MGKQMDNFNDEPQFEGMTEKETRELKVILKRFLKAYKENEKKGGDYEWLRACYRNELPGWSEEQIAQLTEETLSCIKENDENLASAEDAATNGKSSDKWFADKVKDAAANMTVQEFGKKLAELDKALSMANSQMMRTVTTKAGEISLNYNLDGFIAEQHHVNTFNANSALKNSDYKAEVKVPREGETYGLNSFDCVVRNRNTGTRRPLQQYQVKYGADAKATIHMLKEGNYNNQRFLVPSDQVAEVQAAFPTKTVTDRIEIEGVSSTPLTKADAKRMQLEAQETGAVTPTDYNVFQTKELALQIGKSAGFAGLQAAAVTTGFTLAANVLKGDQIDSDEVVAAAIETGADTGVKAAVTGALKVGSEKGIISLIPHGTPVRIISGLACNAIENVKILAKVAKGDLTMSEGLDKMGRTATTMYYGMAWGAVGTAIGTTALSWVPVVGPFVGGAVGGMVGYMAGSKFGSTVYKTAKKVASKAKEVVSNAAEKVKDIGRGIWDGIKGFGSLILG